MELGENADGLRMRRAYLALQGAAVFVWWALIGLVPAARQPFLPLQAPSSVLYAFLVPDCVVLGAGSLACARLWRGGAPPPALWVVAGALWYTTAYVLGLWLSGELAVPGPVLMTLASLGTAWATRAPGVRR